MQGRIDYVDINTSALCDKYLCEDCPAHINAADDVLQQLIKERKKMNDKELCKKCIYYDDFCCRNNKAICVNNSEYRDAEMVINAIINRKEGAKNGRVYKFTSCT